MGSIAAAVTKMTINDKRKKFVNIVSNELEQVLSRPVYFVLLSIHSLKTEQTEPPHWAIRFFISFGWK